MTDGATPRPWKVTTTPFARGERVRISGESTIVANVLSDPNKRMMSRANAELIVRAVNSHDQLVAALRRAIRYFDEAEQHREAWGKMVDDFRAALAAAEGGE